MTQQDARMIEEVEARFNAKIEELGVKIAELNERCEALHAETVSLRENLNKHELLASMRRNKIAKLFKN